MMGGNKVGDMDTVKKTIRALLISAKNGLTPNQLAKDYEVIIGEPLPVKKLGYRSLMDLVYSIPDVIQVTINAYGRITLRGIADTSSRHIAQLVSKQRSTKSYSHIKSHSSTPHLKSPPSRKPEKIVPAQFKVKLRQLLVSYPDGLPMSKFQEAFVRRFGYYVHVRQWGFSSLADALMSIEDVVKLVFRSDEVDGGEYVVYSKTATPRTKDFTPVVKDNVKG